MRPSAAVEGLGGGGITRFRRRAITSYNMWHWCHETRCRKIFWALSGMASTKERGILSMLMDLRSSGVAVLIQARARLSHSSQVCTQALVNLSFHFRHCTRRVCTVCPWYVPQRLQHILDITHGAAHLSHRTLPHSHLTQIMRRVPRIGSHVVQWHPSHLPYLRNAATHFLAGVGASAPAT